MIKFISELGTTGAKGSLIKELVNKPVHDKKAILEYLKSFSPIAASSYVYDYVQKKTANDVRLYAYTDGKYEWTDSDVYHFDKYDLQLNEDFIEFVLNRPHP